MIQRLEIPELPLTCEWDVETGEVGVAFGGGREVSWDRYNALVLALLRESGVTWDDREIRERRRVVCGVADWALGWRARFTPAAGAEWVPALISEAMGARWAW